MPPLVAAGAAIAGGTSMGLQVDAASKQAGAARESEAERERLLTGSSDVEAFDAAEKARQETIARGGTPQEAQQAFDDAMEKATTGAVGATERAFEDAAAQVKESGAQQEAAIRDGTTQAAGALTDAAAQQEAALREGTTGGIDALTGAEQQARADVSQGLQDFSGTLRGGEAQAAGALTAGLQGAQTALQPALDLQGLAAGATQAIDPFDVTGQKSRVGGMLDQPGGLFANFEADPGFKFRQQQGEQALGRAASARGGRLSGRSLKELAEFNSGLAAQEFQNFAARRQAEAGAAAGVDQQTLAALLNQAGRSDAAQQQSVQNQLSLAGIGFGAGSQLAGLTSAQGQSLANLFSGTASQIGQGQLNTGNLLGQIGLGTGQGIAGLLGAQGANLSNVFGAQGQGLAGLFGAQGGALSGIFGGQGSALSSLLTGGNAQQNQLLQALLGNIGSADQFAGSESAALSSGLNTGLNTLSELGGLAIEGGKAFAGGGTPKAGGQVAGAGSTGNAGTTASGSGGFAL